MRPMRTVQDLIEEAKRRVVWWSVCVFVVSYIITHTSKSMWTNIPMSIVVLLLIRYIIRNVDFHWKGQSVQRQSYLSHLAKRQISLSDVHKSAKLPASKWRRKINARPVEAAIQRIVDKILQDFVVDLWYSSITFDKQAPEMIGNIVLEALGEICLRVKETNLVELLTRDMIDLIGNHLALFRQNQLQIGAAVMKTLSSEAIDDRMKHQLLASKKIHPALLSPEDELKFLRQIVGGIMPVVLRSQEAQSQLICCFSRELVTCLVLQPVMNFASPAFINELIVQFLENKDKVGGTESAEPSESIIAQSCVGGVTGAGYGDGQSRFLEDVDGCNVQSPKAEWSVALDAATRRRSDVLAPENLESMWTKGRHYQKKGPYKTDMLQGVSKELAVENISNAGAVEKDLSTYNTSMATSVDDKYIINLMHESNTYGLTSAVTEQSQNASKRLVYGDAVEVSLVNDNQENALERTKGLQPQLKSSTIAPNSDTTMLLNSNEAIAAKENRKTKEDNSSTIGPSNAFFLHPRKLRCRVIGAYYERVGGKSFALYSIAVVEEAIKTWFVRRRYRDFDHLHNCLRAIPNYTLHLPPKSFWQSSTNDGLVLERCILLDKYLQDLLSIANVAEQHEVLDFLDESSLNYSGKSTSALRNLSVIFDDAMNDIARRGKEIVGNRKHKVVNMSEATPIFSQTTNNRLALSLMEDLKHNEQMGIHLTSRSLSDNENNFEGHTLHDNGWHSDNEVNASGFPSCPINPNEEYAVSGHQRKVHKLVDSKSDASTLLSHDSFEDPPVIPAEWMPSNVSVPLLNLVDTVFQLKRRGWIRRQVLWISKQILQLVMEDAIDEWLLRQISWLRSEEVVARGIHWLEDTLWPNGTFFTRANAQDNVRESQSCSVSPQNSNQASRKSNEAGSFEYQLEASRKAKVVKDLLLGGTPVALVSIIGKNQCRRSARDIYYFLQSSVCIKQLAYAMLELVLVTVFPELRQLITDIHEVATGEQGQL